MGGHGGRGREGEREQRVSRRPAWERECRGNLSGRPSGLDVMGHVCIADSTSRDHTIVSPSSRVSIVSTPAGHLRARNRVYCESERHIVLSRVISRHFDHGGDGESLAKYLNVLPIDFIHCPHFFLLLSCSLSPLPPTPVTCHAFLFTPLVVKLSCLLAGKYCHFFSTTNTYRGVDRTDETAQVRRIQ